MRDSREPRDAPRSARSSAVATANAVQSTEMAEEVFSGALRLAFLVLTDTRKSVMYS